MIDITNSCKIDIMNTTEPLKFHEVFAFDIESDGLVGNLAVPGVIILSNVCQQLPRHNCYKYNRLRSPNDKLFVNSLFAIIFSERANTELIAIIGSSLVTAIIIILTSMSIINIVICRTIKR